MYSQSKHTQMLLLEELGQRLDVVRDLQTVTKISSWAKNFWHGVEQQLTTNWKQRVFKLDSKLVQGSRFKPYKINYDFLEGPDPGISSFAWVDRLFHDLSLQDRLEVSWDMAKKKSLEKARQGLI